MSVLNTMLQDLEKRHGQSPQNPGLPMGVKVIAESPKKPLHTPLLIVCAFVIIVLLAFIFQMTYKRSGAIIRKTSPTTVLSPSVVTKGRATPSPLRQITPSQTSVAKSKRLPDSQKQPVIAKLTNPNKPAPTLAIDKPAKPQNTLLVQKNISPTQNAEYQYQQALESIQQGHLGDATLQLKQALQLNPQHDTARETLVSVLLHENKSSEAEQILLEAQNLDPANLEMVMALARLQVEHGSISSALNTLQRSSNYAGNSGEYLVFQASLHQQKGEHAAASKLLERALQANPSNGKWRLALAVSQRSLGQDQLALKNAQAALEDNLPRDLQLLAQQIITSLN